MDYTAPYTVAILKEGLTSEGIKGNYNQKLYKTKKYYSLNIVIVVTSYLPQI